MATTTDSTTYLPKLRTEEEAAIQLTVSKPTLVRFRRRGDIAFRRIGGQIRYTQADIDEYIEKCARPTEPRSTAPSSASVSGRYAGGSQPARPDGAQLAPETLRERRVKMARADRGGKFYLKARNGIWQIQWTEPDGTPRRKSTFTRDRVKAVHALARHILECDKPIDERTSRPSSARTGKERTEPLTVFEQYLVDGGCTPEEARDWAAMV